MLLLEKIIANTKSNRKGIFTKLFTIKLYQKDLNYQKTY